MTTNQLGISGRLETQLCVAGFAVSVFKKKKEKEKAGMCTASCGGHLGAVEI